MKKLFIILILVLFFCPEHMIAQIHAPRNESPFLAKENYIPYPNTENDIVKTVHLAIHVWQRKDGSGNLRDTPEIRQRLQKVIEWVNDHYTNNYVTVPPISYKVDSIFDSKLRFKLEKIYFYKDASEDSAYCYTTQYLHNQMLNDFLKKNYPKRAKTLNLHIFMGKFYAAGYSAMGSIGTFFRTNPDMNDSDVHDWWLSGHWAHELGHGFDLWHTYDSNSIYQQNCDKHYKDFLYDLYDTTVVSNDKSCNVALIPGRVSNDIMGGGEATRISVLQMGIAQRATVLKNLYNTGFNMRDYVTGYGKYPKIIANDQTWDISMKIYQDIVVNPGVTLIIKNEIQMVPQARIFIDNGAKIIVEKGGKITNEKYYDKNWRGIYIRKESKDGKLKAGELKIEQGGEVLRAQKTKYL